METFRRMIVLALMALSGCLDFDAVEGKPDAAMVDRDMMFYLAPDATTTSIDLAVPADLTVRPDQSTLPDLSPTPDLAPMPDMILSNVLYVSIQNIVGSHSVQEGSPDAANLAVGYTNYTANPVQLNQTVVSGSANIAGQGFISNHLAQVMPSCWTTTNQGSQLGAPGYTWQSGCPLFNESIIIQPGQTLILTMHGAVASQTAGSTYAIGIANSTDVQAVDRVTGSYVPVAIDPALKQNAGTSGQSVIVSVIK